MKNKGTKGTHWEYSPAGLKREEITEMGSYIDFTNRLLKIIVPITGVEICQSIFDEIREKHTVLKDSRLTDTGTLARSRILEAVRGYSEEAGLGMIIGAFNAFISRIVEMYSSMSCLELGLAAVISAAKGETKEKLKQAEAAKAGLEWKVEKQTRELSEKVEDLEEFRRVAIKRDLEHINRKAEINYLLEKLGKKPYYPAVHFDEKARENINKMLGEEGEG
ncbi:MAG: hypothetical protein DRP85_08245 [Candidatus Makaraimicrobium thalassicum]|nr:MAG: hypothetical protein DRP85_08245 [Candidatus Omnitrophota bacterium]